VSRRDELAVLSERATLAYTHARHLVYDMVPPGPIDVAGLEAEQAQALVDLAVAEEALRIHRFAEYALTERSRALVLPD
jgi:hypothetical protein